MIAVRPLATADLPAALAIQAKVYPANLREPAPAFASRLGAARPYCFAATRNGALIAYLLSHGWPAMTPPPVGTMIPADAPGDTLLIHDLAVSAAGRGSRIGTALIDRAIALAVRDGMSNAELVAVQGAATYWSRLGFRAISANADLADKLACYGSDAVYMRRALAV